MNSKKTQQKKILSPLLEQCSCGSPTYEKMLVKYPTGFNVEIPICFECSVLAERTIIKQMQYDRTDFEK